MRTFLRALRERRWGVAVSLSILAALLALLSLGLAAYAVYQILSTRQDVWISYPAGDPGAAVAPVLAVIAAAALFAVARGLRKREA